MNQKDYYNSLSMTQKHLVIMENLLMQEKFKQIKYIEEHYLYQEIAEKEQLYQEILIAKKEKKVLGYITTIILLIFICLVLLSFYRTSKIKVKQQYLQSKNMELEKRNVCSR